MQDSGRLPVAVVGAGAVGCYFGGMLARSGVPVTLIGRQPHVAAIARDGLLLETLRFREPVKVAAMTEIGAVRDARVVLFCVKTIDTEAAARELQPHLRSGSVVISLQNGVDNTARIYSAAKIEAIPAVVYVACAMVAPGHVKHSGRGDLIIGDRKTADTAAIAALFEHAEVPCRVSESIEADLWTKLIMNCAFNAISALGGSEYGRIVDFPLTRDLIARIVGEAVAVARAGGISLPEAANVEAALQLGRDMSGATSSTAQDIGRGRPTEIDSLNGYLVRRGAELGVPVPVNRTLHALVKLLEITATGTV
ncbi:MAG: 2-dehydropantoate 2-reductase [Bryobacteraceae bacterium]